MAAWRRWNAPFARTWSAPSRRRATVAEAGARQAIAQLGVGEAEAPNHLTAEQRTLRNRLRAHGRQLGDRRDPKTGFQETAHLAQECAYEHWHRMLFARFLAETDLLIEPESGVAITLEEVQQLAREKATDWLDLASDYAERMLPQIFRKDDPVLADLAAAGNAFRDGGLAQGAAKAGVRSRRQLGWVYQFWQADKKERSTVRGEDRRRRITGGHPAFHRGLHGPLPAPQYARRLVGRQGAGRQSGASRHRRRTRRRACRLQATTRWTYLRFVREPAEDGTEGPWRPAAGAFEGWPKAAKDLTVLDPCMGRDTSLSSRCRSSSRSDGRGGLVERRRSMRC